MPAKLTELGRRVLGHLPVWAEDEGAHIAAEGGPEVSVRSYDLSAFTARLAEDPNLDPPLNETDCEAALEALVIQGLAERVEPDGDADAHWRMTGAGLEALHASPEKEEQVPGAVVVGLDPAVANSIAKGS